VTYKKGDALRFRLDYIDIENQEGGRKVRRPKDIPIPHREI
jgi:hypothetical protein